MGRRIISCYMPMPEDFAYREVFLRGEKIYHGESTALHHARMDCGKRAKIFAPFAALTGFDRELKKKEVPYVRRKILSPQETEEISRKLAELSEDLPKKVTVEYFVYCLDVGHEDYLKKGLYHTYTGILKRIDPVFGELIFAEKTLSLDEISAIVIAEK